MIIFLKIVVAKDAIHVLGVCVCVCMYVPQVGLDEDTECRFWEDLDEVIQRIHQIR